MKGYESGSTTSEYERSGHFQRGGISIWEKTAGTVAPVQIGKSARVQNGKILS